MEKFTDVFVEHFWTIAATVLGTAFAGFVAYRNNKIKRTVEASTAFRNAIDIETIKGLKGRELEAVLYGVVASGIKIEGEYFKHKRAIEEFRIHLGWFDRFRLYLAWNKYTGGNENHPDLFVKYCLPKNGPELLQKRLKKLRSIGNKT